MKNTPAIDSIRITAILIIYWSILINHISPSAAASRDIPHTTKGVPLPPPRTTTTPSKPRRNSKAIKRRAHNNRRMNTYSTPTTPTPTPVIDGDDEIIIGGGSINEKDRRHKNATTTNDRTPANDATNRPNAFDPEHIPAHLLHALTGLDRYPNYLSRWNYNLVEDVQKLESALEGQLDKVRMQKRRLMQRNEHVQSMVDAADTKDAVVDGETSVDWSILRPPTTWQEVRDDVLHPKASEAIFNSKLFRNQQRSTRINRPNHNNSHKRPIITVQDVLEGKITVELDAAQLEEWLEEEVFDVYSFPLLSETFCIRLKHTIQNLIRLEQTTDVTTKGSAYPSTTTTTTIPPLGSRPIDLDTIGASWINNLLFHLILRPLSKHLFTTTEHITNNDLDWRQGFIAGYAHDPTRLRGVQRQKLVPHTDDAEVTLNIGLATGAGVDYNGGDLVFMGLRGTEGEGKREGRVTPMIGRALVHSGRHLHEVEEVTGGGVEEVDGKGGRGRYAFVVWARSWEGLRGGVCPCCWLNRRQDDGKEIAHRCMCSPRYN